MAYRDPNRQAPRQRPLNTRPRGGLPLVAVFARAPCADQRFLTGPPQYAKLFQN